MKEQYIQLCCEFYNEYSPKDREWFGRMYDQCQEDYEKNNSVMFRWQFPLMVLKSQQAKIVELNTKHLAYVDEVMKLEATYIDKISELQNQVNEAKLQVVVHWGADEETDSVLNDIEKVFSSKSKPSANKTDIADCLHFSTTMFHEGKAECFQCGAVVNHQRKVIGVKQ